MATLHDGINTRGEIRKLLTFCPAKDASNSSSEVSAPHPNPVRIHNANQLNN